CALSFRRTVLRGNRRPAARLARQSQNRYQAGPHGASAHARIGGDRTVSELPEKTDPLEQLLDRTLHPLPLRRAPPTLQSRVLEELQRRAALPWWRRSFAHWPSAARAGFVLVCLALIGVV